MDKKNKNITVNLFYDYEDDLQSLIDEYLITLYLRKIELDV